MYYDVNQYSCVQKRQPGLRAGDIAMDYLATAWTTSVACIPW